MSFIPARDSFAHVAQGERVVGLALCAASKPAEDLTVSEWAESYRFVSADSGSPWPGKFEMARTPYLREPQDCLHPDHPARRVTLRWAAQLGKSTILENWAGFIIDREPGSMMITLPTLEEAGKFNKIKLQPTIDASPCLKHKVKPVNSRDEQGSTTSFKKFAGGFIQIVNAGSAKGLQMVSIKYLGMDEITGYPKDADGRGSPRDQARARQKMYGDLAKECQMSTPGTDGDCEISDDFEAGDRRYLYVPCPHCRAFQTLNFDNMTGRQGDVAAHFKCLSCAKPIQNAHKHSIMRDAVWISTIPLDDGSAVPDMFAESELDLYRCNPCEGRCRKLQPSYHLWAAYAPKETFDAVWERWEVAQGNTTKLRTFMQQDLAEPYQPGVDVVDSEKIVDAARAEAVPAGIIPPGAALLISTADVQGYGIKWACFAIGPHRQRWLIDRETFMGAPDQSDDPWIELADALGRTYQTASGNSKGIDLSGVDTGFATQRVYRFCRGRPNVLPLDGRKDQRAGWIGTPTPQKIKDGKGRVLAKIGLYPVYLYDVKTEVAAALTNLVSGPNENTGKWPGNTLHIADDCCDEDLARELTAERLIDPEEEIRSSGNRRRKQFVAPRTKREWRKIAGRANDFFDITVYAFAIGWYLETKRRLNMERWEALIFDLHGAATEDDLFTAAENSPFASRSKTKKRISMADIASQLNS